MMHGHDDSEPCGLNCPVGGADGRRRVNDTSHSATVEGITLCSDKPLTADELAALREFFRMLRRQSGDSGDD